MNKKIPATKWKYTTRDYVCYVFDEHLKDKIKKDCTFKDDSGKIWAHLYRDGKLIINEGYSWDGCSPKFVFFDFLIGTPDGATNSETTFPKTYSGSLVHDVLYQFIDNPNHSFTRKDIDKIFLSELNKNDFFWATVYYIAVRLFGKIKERLEFENWNNPKLK